MPQSLNLHAHVISYSREIIKFMSLRQALQKLRSGTETKEFHVTDVCL